MMISFDDCVHVGRITKKWGFNNEVFILLEETVSHKIRLAEFVFVEINRKLIPFFLSSEKKHGKNGRIVGLPDISEILLDKIIGCNVWVSATNEDAGISDFSAEEPLQGYLVTDVRLGEIGRAVRLIEREMQPLLLVEHKNKEILLPFIPQIIKKTDHKKRQILVDTPEGLTDL